MVTTQKFSHPLTTAKGEDRAFVHATDLATVWINTGTRCNLTCDHCYIFSSPTNDSLLYVDRADVTAVLDEIRDEALGVTEIGFTGGEPFLNPDIMAHLRLALERGFTVLMLTNAMRPMQRHTAALTALAQDFPDRMTFRVSIDHHTAALHETERGAKSWAPMVTGMDLLATLPITLSVAGRTCWREDMATLRAGFQALFVSHNWPIDAARADRLILFPEMDGQDDVAEITTACWAILDKHPSQLMCHDARMVVKRKGQDHLSVAACTLLPHEEEFDLGATLKGSLRPVHLNHSHCAKFCVLGGASCSG